LDGRKLNQAISLQLLLVCDKEAIEVSFADAIGRVAKDTVFLYPPGIPVILPGERIEEDFIKNIRKCKALRLNLQGVADIINERINVVNF